MPYRLFIPVLLLFLGACVPETAPPAAAPDAAASDAATAFDPNDLEGCVAAGGRIGFVGMSGGRYCQAPAPDAGQACTRASDCSSYCMAETQTCAPHISPPGCMEAILLEDGREVLAECAD